MTPEEILRDLRDIHLPEQATNAAGAGFVLWPTALVVTLALFAAWLAWRRRSSWRREIIGHLDAIERDVAEGRAFKGWTDLAILLRRIAMRLCDRRDIAGLIGDAWLEKLDQLFKTDVFSDGPGRGVIVFPYGNDIADDRQGRERMADQLRATIDDVRKNLSHLRVAR